MLDLGPLPPMAEAVEAARDYLRLDEDGDDALIAGLADAAVLRCEAFVGWTLIERSAVERFDADGVWHRLGALPVAAITGAEAIGADASVAALSPGAYEIDLQSDGTGRFRLIDRGDARRVRVAYRAGRWAGWDALPLTLRQGMLRLISHGYVYRERDEEPAMPTAVTALWMPMRRLRLK